MSSHALPNATVDDADDVRWALETLTAEASVPPGCAAPAPPDDEAVLLRAMRG